MRRLTALLIVTGMSLVGIATVAGPAAYATFPGSNGRIVFGAETRHSGYELFVVRANGDHLTRITHADGDAVHPDWSPDGRQIVFELDHPSGPPFCSIILMNAEGTHMVDLTGQRTGCEGQPSFAPDGRRIVFGRFNDVTNVEAIWSMSLDGGDRHRITTGIGRGVTDPNASPNGELVSFIEYSGNELSQAIATVDFDGSYLDKVVPFSFDVAVKHDWAPNGRQLVFTNNADDFERPANILTVRPDGADRRHLTHYRRPNHRAYVGGYSPNGNWIVFRLEVGDRSGLYRMRADGTDRTEILPLSSFRPRFIDWGPQPT
jgi:Tol biopolymer transport system component